MKFTDNNQPKYRSDYIKYPKECIEYWMDYHERNKKTKKWSFKWSFLNKLKKWI